MQVDFDEQEAWLQVRRGAFLVIANLAADPRPHDVGAAAEVVLSTGDTVRDGAWLTLTARSAAVVRTA